MQHFLRDVSDIKYVVNYDYPNNSEDYVHRIGRTGRRDNIGVSYTFFTQQNGPKARDLIKVLDEAKQVVPEELQRMAASGGGGAGSSRGRGRPPMKRDAGGYGGGGYGGSPSKRTRYDAGSSYGGQGRGGGFGGGSRW
uniref:Helicase C-terminal domain-containing protein n=1 Tax=Panagrolaimus superbus TaxID=310955 RepID=A0A914YUT1_9BILA